MATRPISGLQKDVLSLYRRVLREACRKDRQAFLDRNESSPSFGALLTGRAPVKPSTSTTRFAASEFRRQAATVKRSDFKKIEYMIRKGDKQIKLLRTPGVRVVGGTGTSV